MAVGEVMASKQGVEMEIMATVLTQSESQSFLLSAVYQNDGSVRQIPEEESLDNEATRSAMAYDYAGAICLPRTVYLTDSYRNVYEETESAAPAESGVVSKWRMKDRMKTGCVALVLCLNIGVDPADVIKISPCARMECWIDPFSMPAPRALETIGRNLQSQYERWQPRARYRVQLDPTADELKKLCSQCRKSAKSERVLFHYNGHGVPKPTINGEIWLFNRTYTQYIPLSVYELDSWLGTPSIYVFDCSAAGMILNAFCEHPEWGLNSPISSAAKDFFLLAACGANEILPQHAELPADVFTACLTTPIKIALRWFCSRSLLKDSLDSNLIDEIPGRQNDRKTPLGELNWIFTAITDTIAWNVLPRDLFQRLFRQDLLVASLFRNFLLAERIMRASNCTPLSYPRLPSTHQHHMWHAWDMAAEMCLAQLPGLLTDSVEFKPSSFFSEQLTAFEVWLNHGSQKKKPPEQLPIVLQVLLSQSHRFRALVLLGRFLDMGAWAVDLALSVGIFPYVLKLLQTTAADVKHILVFIWTKILALDKSCQVDLVKDNGHQYFIKFLTSHEISAENRAMAAFVLTVIVDGHRRGQEECMECGLISTCLQLIQSLLSADGQRDPLFLKWLCLCLGKLWEGFDLAQQKGFQAGAPAILMKLLSEPQPEVRAAATFCLGTLIAIDSDAASGGTSLDDDYEDEEGYKAELETVNYLLKVVYDGSPLVRAELAIGLSRFAISHSKLLKPVAAAYLKPPTNSVITSLPALTPIRSPAGSYSTVAQIALSGSSVGVHRTPSLRGSLSIDQSFGPTDGSIFLGNEQSNNGDHRCRKQQIDESSFYVRCVSAMYTLGRDPSPHVASFGRQVLRMIGVEPVIVDSVITGCTTPSSGAGGHERNASIGTVSSNILSSLPRSFSWIDSPTGNLTVTFRTPPASPPAGKSILSGSGMRRVCSLEFSPHLWRAADSGLAYTALVGSGHSRPFESVAMPSSNLYNWSSYHFARPLLESSHDDDDDYEIYRSEKEQQALDGISKCEHSNVARISNQIASFDIDLPSMLKSVLLHPFIPIVLSADENEVIRIWDYEELTLVNIFDNHKASGKGVSRICLLNELDSSLLLVASSDGCVRIWKDYTQRDNQNLLTAWHAVQGHRPGVRNMNVVVDWQQYRGFLYASGEVSSIAVWDLNSELVAFNMPSQSDSMICSLSASQHQDQNVAAGYDDGSVRIFDIRSRNPACTVTLHKQKIVNADFLPEINSNKMVSASVAGDLKFFDMRQATTAYLEVDAHSTSLSALCVHRHAPFIACGSSKQFIKVFNLQGEQLSFIRYQNSFLGQKIGPISALYFHPYKIYLAAGATDSNVSVYSGDIGST